MFTLPIVAGIAAFAVLSLLWLTVRYIPNDRIGIVEKLWSLRGSLTEGAVIALRGEAGYQADIVRGGIHFGLWRRQYAVHTVPLVTISGSSPSNRWRPSRSNKRPPCARSR